MIGMKRDKRTTTPNEHIEITITGLGSSGEGVGKVKGFTYFIPGALPGERVTAAVTAKRKTTAWDAWKRSWSPVRTESHRPALSMKPAAAARSSI